MNFLLKSCLLSLTLAATINSANSLDLFKLFKDSLQWFLEESDQVHEANFTAEERIGSVQFGPIVAFSRIAEISKKKTTQDPEENKTKKLKKRTHLLELALSLNLTTFVQKAKEAGLEDVLDHEGPFTLFVPTNEAFDRTPNFCRNVPIQDLMKFHVGRGAITSDIFKDNLIVRALLAYRGIRINLYPDNKVVTANGRRITKSDFKASNGILHIIDDVMCAVYEGNAVTQINKCPELSILSKAINITGLYNMLNGPSPVTIFAPTDHAFKKIPSQTLDDWLKNKTKLTEILEFHFVPNVWYSAGLRDGLKLKTIQGQSLTVSISSTDNITVNNAVVDFTDATVGNGVVHSVDTVLIPKMMRNRKYSFSNFFKPE